MHVALESAEHHESQENSEANEQIRIFLPIRKADPYRRMAKAMRKSRVADNLLNRKFTLHGWQKMLLTDITYIPHPSGVCYLSTILDAYIRQVLVYVLSDFLEVGFLLETVHQIVRGHGISLSKETLIYSDQGYHYTSILFMELVKNKKLRQSMSRKANSWNNASQESFFGHMKDEIDVSGCKNYHEVKDVIDD